MKAAIKQQIEEIQKYFIFKVSTGEYEIAKSNENFVTVMVDNEYLFNIWIGNGSKYCDFYKYSVEEEHFISMPELSLDQKLVIWETLNKKINHENLPNVSIQDLIHQYNNSI
jgi:hypothetical protein